MFDIKQNLSLDQQCNMKFDIFLLMFTLESNIIFFFLKKKRKKEKKYVSTDIWKIETKKNWCF